MILNRFDKAINAGMKTIIAPPLTATKSQLDRCGAQIRTRSKIIQCVQRIIIALSPPKSEVGSLMMEHRALSVMIAANESGYQR